MAEGDAWRSAVGDPRLARHVCTHPNCERHGKSPVVGIGCDGRGGQAERRRAIQAHLAEWGAQEELSFPAASQPLAASEGSVGVPGRGRGSDGAPGGAERVEKDGLAKLLAFRFGVPPVEGEGGWARLTHADQGYWEAEADMVRGYLVHGLGWKAP